MPTSAGTDSSGIGSSALGLGALGLGAAGFGAILGQGESPLPSQFASLDATVGPLEGEAQNLANTGAEFTGQGKEALGMAQRGELTAPQTAQLALYKQGLENKATQTYASMGRNINQDTSGISTQANIDQQINAMAQQQIQSTIALGLGETSAGASFSGEALQFQSAANNALIQAGQAQIAQDKSYSDSLSSVFGAIGKLAGAVLPAIL